MGKFGIYAMGYEFPFKICHLSLYQTHSIIMATMFMDTLLCKWKDSNILAYTVKIQSTVINVLQH